MTAAGDGSSPTLVLVTGDLFLGSRIRGFAVDAGYQVRAAVSERGVPDETGTLPDRVVADLSSPRLSLTTLCESFGATAPQRIAAYAPHIRTDLLRAARAAGLVSVFTRSQLEDELPRWLASR